ncbi:acyl-CoA carboxylase epsilon subunit [Streptomyces sp. NBC_01465]|uniref:acyl-CoA carboxylase epsilon subunit n=1 Tax=Streptomyces sp. NBC_01465 TaxID=2903878 RepID=UPI002E37D788|nr:acyl-CoA carboxylase epsilon subunit [Streptomyces sp. NBC_01465]
MTTSIAPAAAPLVRVERGHATDDELAALTVLLLTRAEAQEGRESAAGHTAGSAPRWERLERNTAYRTPGSWRKGQ